MTLISSCSCLFSIHWNQVISWEWRCSWSSADRRCSNYIWVINDFIALGATYIRGLTVMLICVLQAIFTCTLTANYSILWWLSHGQVWIKEQSNHLIHIFVNFKSILIAIIHIVIRLDTLLSCHGSQTTSNSNVCSTDSSPNIKVSFEVLHCCPLNRESLKWPVDSPHKGPVIQKAFPCHNAITSSHYEQLEWT